MQATHMVSGGMHLRFVAHHFPAWRGAWASMAREPLLRSAKFEGFAYVQAPVHGPGGLGWFICVLKSTPLGLAAPPGALGATTSPAKWSCSSVFCEAGGCLIVSRHRVAPFYARLTTPITIPDRPAVQDRDQRAPWRATKVRANRASSKFVCR